MARTLLILCLAAASLAAKDRAWQTGQVLDKALNPYFRTVPASADGGRVSGNATFVSGDNGVLATNTRASDGDVSYDNYVIASADAVYLVEFAHFKTFPVANISVSKPVTFAVEKNKLFIMDLDHREFETTILKQMFKNGLSMAAAEQPAAPPADPNSKLEQARAEQARAAQARAEQAKAEQARIDQARADQAKAAQLRAEQAKAEQARVDQLKAEQAKAEQARLEQARAEQAKAAQARAEQIRADQAKAAQAKADQAKAEQARLEQARAEQAKAEQARLEQARAEQAKAAQAKAEQAKAEQARIEQARAEQAKAAQAKADQAKAEQARLDQARADQAKAEQARLEQARAEQARVEKPKSSKPDNVFATAALTNDAPPKPAPAKPEPKVEAALVKPVQRPEAKPEGPVVRASTKDRAWQSGQLLSVANNSFFFNVTYTSDIEGSTWPFAQGSDGRLTVTGQIAAATNSQYTYDNYVIESQFVAYLVQRMRPKTSPPVRLPGTRAMKFAVDKGKMWVLDEQGIEYETKVVKLIQKDAIVDPLARASAR